MNSITSFTPADIISLHQGQPVTTSLKVAAVFGKQHKDVLRKIANLDCSKDFNERNFALVTYQDGKGEARPAYEMTKDGFIFVVMGFTGAKAAATKEAYINAFNWMAEQLTRRQQATTIHLPTPNGSDGTYCGRLLVNVEYNQVIDSSPLPSNAFIATAYTLGEHIRTPGILNIDQLHQIAELSLSQIVHQATELAQLNRIRSLAGTCS